MSRPEQVRRLMRRRKSITSREVAEHLGIDIRYAGAITCTLANRGFLTKRTKIRKPGVRWFWKFTRMH